MNKEQLIEIKNYLNYFIHSVEEADLNEEENRIYNNAVRLHNDIKEYLKGYDNPDRELIKRFSPNKRFATREFKFKCNYKGYTILEARLNPHNAQYCIKELGDTLRWEGLQWCKEYIRVKLLNIRG